ESSQTPEKETEAETEKNENKNTNKKRKKNPVPRVVRGIPRDREPHKNDKSPEEVARLLRYLTRTRPAAVRLIERSPAKCVTRMQKRVFERAIRFDGSVEEWEGGRKEREMSKLQKGVDIH